MPHQPPKSVQVRIERAFQHHETAAWVLSTESQANIESIERTLRERESKEERENKEEGVLGIRTYIAYEPCF